MEPKQESGYSIINPPNTDIEIKGDVEQTVLTYDPMLMGSVQSVPPPPAIKPSPPKAPPPKNATAYNPTKDLNKFKNEYTPAHNHYMATQNKDDDIDNKHTINSANPQSIWNDGKYKMYDYNSFDPLTGQYSIKKEEAVEPPLKKRKLSNSDNYNCDYVSDKYSERYSLCSLGFQPLEARAIIEKLDCCPKLRYAEEFNRDINNALQMETSQITKKLLQHNDIQKIYPTSNGKSTKYLYTERGINPNDKASITKLRAHVISKSIKNIIFTKQKQALEEKMAKIYKVPTIMSEAKKKSNEIAKKLGFVPAFLKETKVQKDKSENQKVEEMKESHLQKLEAKNKAMELERNGLIAPPPLKKQSAFSCRFECKSVLKSDGSEYDMIRGSKLHSVKKYDANFRPMYPITNRDYTFSVVSKYGFAMLRKWGYKEGDGLGKYKQGVTTFPRLIGQNNVKGINYKKVDRSDPNNGFIHCTACDKSFCGYDNLRLHVICKKHKKNLAQKPNNLVLLCVQCQLQFPTCQKIKEHYMLVQHDHSIPGIATFQKQLRDELRANQIKYIQSLKTKENPFKEEMIESESEEEKEKNIKDEKVGIIKQEFDSSKDDKKEMEEVKGKLIEMKDEKKVLPGLVSTPSPFIKGQRPQMMNYANYAQVMAAHPGWISYGNNNIVQTSYSGQVQNEIVVDGPTCADIKHYMHRLGIKLPLAVPSCAWVYCPLCKSFFTTFSKYNQHETTQRHVIALNGLQDDERVKMTKLFEYIKQKEQEVWTQNTLN